MSNARILVVDDDEKLLRVLTLRLEAEGYGPYLPLFAVARDSTRRD